MIPQKRSGVDPSRRQEIDSLCWLIEDAFVGGLSESLMNNLAHIREQDWTALPAGGGRSIVISWSTLAGANGCMKTMLLALPACVATSNH